MIYSHHHTIYSISTSISKYSHQNPLIPRVSPTVGLIILSLIGDFMGDCNDNPDDPVTIRGRMDERGRFTIREDDRIALGVDDLADGERAILEMETKVVARVGADGDD